MTQSDPFPGSRQEPAELALQAVQFARERLGPASESLLLDPAVQVKVLSRLRAGFDREDAVLAEVHRAAAVDRIVADEFIAYFLKDLLRVGKRMASANLRRFLDTGDLVQSVLGDVWPELRETRFETRGRFLAFLSQRLRWKAGSKARRANAGKRREDLRVDACPSDMQLEGDGASPSRIASDDEDRQRLAVAILRLPERDQSLLKGYLQGLTLEQLASQLDLSYNATRIALQRAIRKAKSQV